jgi:hypothetical protein
MFIRLPCWNLHVFRPFHPPTAQMDSAWSLTRNHHGLRCVNDLSF